MSNFLATLAVLSPFFEHFNNHIPLSDVGKSYSKFRSRQLNLSCANFYFNNNCQCASNPLDLLSELSHDQHVWTSHIWIHTIRLSASSTNANFHILMLLIQWLFQLKVFTNCLLQYFLLKGYDFVFQHFNCFSLLQWLFHFKTK